MRESDAATISGGVAGKELMWRAGKAIFEAYEWYGKTAIVCGSGNNAGDGYVLALLLREKGIPCTLVLLGDRFSEDGGYYFQKCRDAGVEVVNYSPDFDFSAYSEIVDCIFGTGFSGAVHGIAADAIQKINASDAYVISVDINSGLCGDNGKGEIVVKSDLTLSIGFYQHGHFLGNAKDVMKSKRNLDIGIGLLGEAAHLLEANDVATVFSKRRQNTHKGSYGYVAVMGGCREYSGAVKLANMSCAALRSGCGVSTLIVPESILGSVAPYLLESTVAPISDKNGHMIADFDEIDRILGRQDALAIGMGWGRDAAYSPILEHILKHFEMPIVIDADGLNTLAEMDLSLLADSKCHIILTPHLKEFSRLSGYSIAEIEENPIEKTREFAAKYKVILLLKGACTIVTDGNDVYLTDRGCAGMATAGSGDVLSGVLVGLLGYTPPTAFAIACGAFVTGLAGELAEKEVGEVSMLASDTVRHLPRAIREIVKVN